LVDNFPRVLPENCDAVIDTRAWKIPPIFEHIEQGGGVDREEMFQVFNMGIGMALVVAEKDAADVVEQTKGRWIGRIEDGSKRVRLEFA
jgi:phosphoribosylformylglycinamidine cyclo-ligase